MDELTLADYIVIYRRWKKVFFLTTLILFVLSLLYALHWSTYRSTAVVQIEPSEISANAVTPTGVNPSDMAQALADQRVSEIQQKVLSTASLIDIITKFDLYASARKNTPIAVVANAMANKIKVDLISGAQAPGSDRAQTAIAFKISFDYSNPLLTQEVTDDLVTRFLDEDLKEKRTETHDTAAFLDTQISDLEASMSEQEKKIADYEKEQGVSRPESLAFNQQAAQSTAFTLQNLEAQMTTNEGTIGSLRGQLATVDPYSRVISDGQVMTTPTIQLKSLQAQYASLTAQYGPDYPDVVKVQHQIEALQGQVGHMSGDTMQLRAQIADVKTNLAAAQKTYGPDHPDVIALQDQLQKLENELATQRLKPSPLGDGIAPDADNPAYLQLALQLRAAEEQHKSLLTQRQALHDQQATYQKAITENPEAEKQLAELSRDYENAQSRYRELKEKKMAADMDEQMQNDRKGQRLTLINPPQLPLSTTPPRILLVLGGLIFSLLGGLTSIFVAQTLRQSVVGAHHVEAIVGQAPLVLIPHIYTNEERERSQRWQAQAQTIRTHITRRIGLS